MSTLTLSLDYQGTNQEDAVADLKAVKRTLRAAVKTLGGKAYMIGSLLNQVKDSGLLIAAANDIDSNKREWKEDGRQTAVAKFVKDNLAPLTVTRANEYQQLAMRRDEGTDAGIDMSAFGDLSRKAGSKMKAEDFTGIIQGMLDDIEDEDIEDAPAITADTFLKAGRDAKLIAPAAAGGGGDALTKAVNALTQEVKKALADEVSVKKAAGNRMKALAAALIDLAG